MFSEDSSTVDISQTDEYLFPSQQESETTFRQELHKPLREILVLKTKNGWKVYIAPL